MALPLDHIQPPEGSGYARAVLRMRSTRVYGYTTALNTRQQHVLTARHARDPEGAPAEIQRKQTHRFTILISY